MTDNQRASILQAAEALEEQAASLRRLAAGVADVLPPSGRKLADWASLFAVSTRTMGNWVRDGVVEAQKVRGRWVIDPKEITSARQNEEIGSKTRQVPDGD